MIIYWVTNNLFTLGQQQWVLRKFPPPVTASATAKPARRPSGPAQPAKSRAVCSVAEAGARPPAKPAAPKVAGPKPGAKPVNPKKGGPAKRQG